MIAFFRNSSLWLSEINAKHLFLPCLHPLNQILFSFNNSYSVPDSFRVSLLHITEHDQFSSCNRISRLSSSVNGAEWSAFISVSRVTQSELCARPPRNSCVGDNNTLNPNTLELFGLFRGEVTLVKYHDNESVGPVRSSTGCGLWDLRLEGCDCPLDSAHRGSSASNSRRSTALLYTLPLATALGHLPPDVLS